MLRVTIELVPHGDESRAKRIGEMIIANDSTGSYERGNYKAVIDADQWTGDGIKHANLQNWDRRNNVWGLIETLLSVAQTSKLPEDSLYHRMVKRFRGSK